MGPRIFTVEKANALLPQLESLFASLDEIRRKLRHLKGKLDVLEMIWGEEVRSEGNPDHREYSHYLSELEGLRKEYEVTTRKFVDLEVQPKSIESGLVDFYGVIDERLVYLCWRRGEPAVNHYHSLEDGFAGRRPIADGA